MKRQVSAAIAWIALLLLVVTHMDFWRPQEVSLVAGWLPFELAYRIVWLLAAWLYMVFLCRLLWPEERS